MGLGSKKVIMEAPVETTPDAAAVAAVSPPPAPQTNPSAQRGSAAAGAATLAAGMGMNNTVLTSPIGTTAPAGASRKRGTLLGY